LFSSAFSTPWEDGPPPPRAQPPLAIAPTDPAAAVAVVAAAVGLTPAEVVDALAEFQARKMTAKKP